MSASTQEDRALLAQHLRAALAAVESGDEEQIAALMNGVCTVEQRPLAQGIVRLAHDLRKAIRELDLDSRISGLAHGEIQDACTHLDHVVRMTEEAAHRTLDLVEDSRQVVDDLQRAGGEAAADAVERLRNNLMSLALAQEYQDLSGQLIRRVIALVRQVESALIDLVRIAGPALGREQGAGTTLKDHGDQPIGAKGLSVTADGSPGARLDLKGPAAANSASQQDADALLADLGF
jgi:chemotaxis protein CheZ